MESIVVSSILLIRFFTCDTKLGLIFRVPLSPRSGRVPAATAISVAVSVAPPKIIASEVIRYPTDSGPTVASPCASGRTSDPPPKPMLQFQESLTWSMRGVPGYVGHGEVQCNPAQLMFGGGLSWEPSGQKNSHLCLSFSSFPKRQTHSSASHIDDQRSLFRCMWMLQTC